MAAGIMITGSSGAGKTTLGEVLAKELGYIFVDIDEYIWRKDTEIPFSIMYSKDEKISRLQDAISDCEHFVMAGSMDSFHEYFDPYFEMVVHLQTEEKIRVRRVHKREMSRFGNRILEGGDMYEKHLRMLTDITGYDYGIGGCTLQQHKKWINSLDCKTLYLDGADPLEKNIRIIMEIYKSK